MRSKADIQAGIRKATEDVLTTVEPLSDTLFFQSLDNGKWSVAETLQHLYLVTRSLNKILPGPREVFRQWGNARHPSKSFEEIQKAYQVVTSTPLKAPDQVSPRAADINIDRQTFMERFTSAQQSLAASLEGWSEEDLDTYQIPHLVLGLITVREMLFFTILHIYHHLKPTQERLSKVTS